MIGNAEKESIGKRLTYARQREHWFIINGPGQTATPPGDNPEYVCTLPVNFRCVFTYTFDITAQRLHRHLSVSNPGKPNIPHPFAIGEIAHAFGFTGWTDSKDEWPEDWDVEFDHNTRSVEVMQRIHMPS